MNSMFETLMSLPLFKGVTRERLSETIGTTKFHFLKYLPDNIIIQPGDPCTHLVFLLAGAMRLTITNGNKRFRILQTLRGADVVMPVFLFGRETHYPCEAVALEPCNILQIAKSDYLRILRSDSIFLINYLNMLAARGQNTYTGIMAVTSGSLEERLAVWILCLTQPTATDIVIQCKQRDLYSMFGVQRSSFMNALESLRERELIDFNANEIMVHERRALSNLITSSIPPQ